jgi:hypothetical protein
MLNRAFGETAWTTTPLSPALRSLWAGFSVAERRRSFDSGNFWAMITNPPKVAEIVLQRLIEAGAEIGPNGVETQKEPPWERMTW